MPSDLISRGALFEDCLNQLNRFNISAYEFENCYPYWIFHKAIKEAPDVDAVEVVRCKDCKHYAVDINTYISCCARNGKVVGGEVWGGYRCEKNGFCNYGERREEDAEQND